MIVHKKGAPTLFPALVLSQTQTEYERKPFILCLISCSPYLSSKC